MLHQANHLLLAIPCCTTLGTPIDTFSALLPHFLLGVNYNTVKPHHTTRCNQWLFHEHNCHVLRVLTSTALNEGHFDMLAITKAAQLKDGLWSAVFQQTPPVHFRMPKKH